MFLKIILIALIIIFSNSHSVYPKSFNENTQIISNTPLAIGVVHTNEVIYNFMNKQSNNQNINYIEMDLNLLNSTYSLMCHKSKNLTSGKMTLSNQVLKEQSNGKNIIGAINGDFFNISNGIPVCSNVINGEFFSTSLTKDDEVMRPCFAILENNKIDIDNYHFKGFINLIDNKCYKTQLTIDSINRMDYIEDTLNIFNAKCNDVGTIFLPKEKEDAIILSIIPENYESSFYNKKTIKGKINQIIKDPANMYKLKDNEIILVAYNNKKELLNKAYLNMDIEIDFEIKKSSNYSSPKVNHLLTGHEFILYDGQILPQNYFSRTWTLGATNIKNYRTAIALTNRNTLIITTIDKKDDFKGMSLTELAHYLKSKGAYKAINLDGGGSTSMMIRKPGIYALEYINLPREHREISNSIMITNNLPYTSDVKDFYFHDSPILSMTDHKKLNIVAYDSNFNPLDIYKIPTLKLYSDVGTFNEEGIFFPINEKIKGYITIEVNDISKTYKLEIT